MSPPPDDDSRDHGPGHTPGDPETSGDSEVAPGGIDGAPHAGDAPEPDGAPEPDDAEADFDGVTPAVVVFDVGEVLIDESRVWAVWASLLGFSPLTFGAVLGAAIAQGEDHEAVFPHLAPNIDWQDFVDEHERVYGGFQEADLYLDVRPCLDELRELGFTIAIAGNQPSLRSEQLVGLGLPHDLVVTSQELGVEKPDPRFFTELLARLDVEDPGELLYVGDRVDNDVLPAAAAGLRTCWLRRGPWGHLQQLPEDVEVDLVLEGLGEFPLLLSHWRDGDAPATEGRGSDVDTPDSSSR